MPPIDGSLARRLDFDESSGTASRTAVAAGRRMLRLAPATRLTGPDKYDVLEARRRHAQIEARRLLDLLDE